jgi:alcohol dehydrogenase class IV
MNFEFATAGRIIFGAGSAQKATEAITPFGSKILLVTGLSIARAQFLVDALHAQGCAVTIVTFEGEPTVNAVLAGVQVARESGAQVVVGLGGGSSMDAAKAIAALTTNPGDPYDYLEVIGRALPLPNGPLPVVAMPTTAGTGSEVTRNAVLASPEHQVKVSVRSPLMLPRVAIVDPELTMGMPAHITASTGMDALTQVLEPFVSPKGTPLTDAICREALPKVARALPLVHADGNNLAARTDMSFASLCGGLALANAGLGAVHGFAGPLGGMFSAPHGAVCAALLAPATRVNLQALRARAPQDRALARYDEAARLCLGSESATADDLPGWLAGLTASLGIPGLAAYDIAEADFAEIIPKSAAASSMKANPIVLTHEELAEILFEAL